MSECCGVCTVAAKAARPRLDADNADDWAPPNLNDLKGAKHRQAREAEDGDPMLLFWQMEGRRWQLDTKSFDTAKKAWRRLAASDSERREESAKRQARAWAEEDCELQERREQARALEQELRDESRAEKEERIQEERARRWREVRAVLRHCGLERLFSEVEWMREDGVLVSLYEPEPTRAHRGLLGAVACFLAGGDSEGAHAVTQLGVSLEEAAQLRRSIVLFRFERFIEAALSSLKLTVAEDEQLLSIEALSGMLYGAWSLEHTWVDLAERVGSAVTNGECIDGLPLSELLRRTVLSNAADDILRLACNHYRMRLVLGQVLHQRAPSIRVHCRQGSAERMWAMLKYSLLGSDGHFNSLLWFFGQLEHDEHGRLWAVEGLTDALHALCGLAHSSRQRTHDLVAKVLRHSVVLREPLRLFIDSHWAEYYHRTWQTSTEPKLLETKPFDFIKEDLDRHMRCMCTVLLRTAIEEGRQSPPHLLLLSTLRSASDQGGACMSQLCSRLATACQVKYRVQDDSTISVYRVVWNAPEEAMVYLCESVKPYLDGLPEAAPVVPPYIHPPSTAEVEDMWYGCVEGEVLDKEWAKLMEEGGMAEFGINQPRGGWKGCMSLGEFRRYVAARTTNEDVRAVCVSFGNS